MNEPQMHPVQSSTISEIGYNAATLELHVKFKSGHYHVYTGVSPGQYLAFSSADSKGKHFYERIRGRFQSTKR